MSEINFNGATIKHKRGDTAYWNNKDTAEEYLQQGEIGLLLDDDGIPVVLKVGDGSSPFLSETLPSIPFDEFKQLNDTHVSSVIKVGDEYLVRQVIDGQSSELLIQGGAGGDTAEKEYIIVNNCSSVAEERIVNKLDECDNVMVDFEAAAFVVDKATRQIITSVYNLEYEVWISKDNVSFSKLNSRSLFTTVGSCSPEETVVLEDTTVFPMLKGDDAGYNYSHSVDVLPLLKAANLESNKKYYIKVIIKAGSAQPCYKLLNVSIRQPIINSCSFTNFVPFSGDALFNGINVDYTVSGHVGSGTISPRLYWEIKDSRGRSVSQRTEPMSNTQWSYSIAVSTPSSLTNGVYTFYSRIELFDSASETVTSQSETVCRPFLVTDGNGWQIYDTNYTEQFEEGAEIFVPFIVSIDKQVTTADAILCCYNDSDCTDPYGLAQRISITNTPTSQYYFTLFDYPVGVDFYYKLCVVPSGGEIGESEASIVRKCNVTQSELSKDISDVTPYAYQFDVVGFNTPTGMWAASGNRSDEVSGVIAGHNHVSDGLQIDDAGKQCIEFSGDSVATLNINEQTAKDDVTLMFDFAVPSYGSPDTTLFSCGDVSTTGFRITPTAITVSVGGASITRRFDATNRIKLGITVRNEQSDKVEECKFSYIYINGVLCGVMPHGTTFNSSAFSTLQVGNPSSDAILNVYSIRQYDRYVSLREHLQAYIATIPTVGERHFEYLQNDILDNEGFNSVDFDKVKSKMPTITIIGQLPGKKDAKKTALVHITYPEDWNMQDKVLLTKKQGLDVQGTSSQFYRRKNFKFKLNESETLIRDELPASVYCIKVDFAEGTSTHNTQNAIITEQLYRSAAANIDLPLKNDEIKEALQEGVTVSIKQNGKKVGKAVWTPSSDKLKEVDKIRTTVAGFPAVLYYYTPDLNDLYGGNLEPGTAEDKSTQSPVAEAYLKRFKEEELSKLPSESRVFYSKCNLNFDKDAENVFGFTSILDGEVTVDELTDIDTSEAEKGATLDRTKPVQVSVKPEGIECWEFTEDGEYQKFKVPPTDIHGLTGEGFFKQFEPRFHKDYGTYEDLADTPNKTAEDLDKLNNLRTSIPSKLMALYEWVYSTDITTVGAFPGAVDVTYDWDVRVSEKAGKVVSITVKKVSPGRRYQLDNKEYRLAKFKQELSNYFDLDALQTYFIYTSFALMVDQRAKNMFFTFIPDNPLSKDCTTGKWYPYFYDNDTSFGIDNTGVLTLEYYNEDFGVNTNVESTGKPVYQGAQSPLWYNLYHLFFEEIRAKYGTLRSSGTGFNPDDIYAKLTNDGNDHYIEMIYNVDAVDKYFASYREALDNKENVGNTYHNVKGPETTYLQYFLKYRTMFFDGKFGWTSVLSDGNNDVIRFEPAEDIVKENSVKVKPYFSCYIPDALPDNPETAAPVSSTYCSSDNEYTLILKDEGSPQGAVRRYFCLPQLFSSISFADNPLEAIGALTLTKFVNLTKLDLSNLSAKDVALGHYPLLTELTAKNFEIVDGGRALDLTSAQSLKKVDITRPTDLTKKNNWTTIDFANSDTLETVVLPEGITKLSFNNQNHLQELVVPQPCWDQSITSIDVHSSSISGKDLFQLCIENLYDTRYSSGNVSNKLTSISGTTYPEVSGLEGLETFLSKVFTLSDNVSLNCTVTVGTIEEKDLEIYSRIMEYAARNKGTITIQYAHREARISYYGSEYTELVTMDAGTNNSPQWVDINYNGVEPSKESDSQYTYQFIGWSTSNTTSPIIWRPGDDPITVHKDSAHIYGSCMLYPVFKATTRKYTMTITDSLQHSVLWRSDEVEYGTVIDRSYCKHNGSPLPFVKDGEIDFSDVNLSIEGSSVAFKLQAGPSTYEYPTITNDWTSVQVTQNIVYTQPATIVTPNKKIVEVTKEDINYSVNHVSKTITIDSFKQDRPWYSNADEDGYLYIRIPQTIEETEADGVSVSPYTITGFKSFPYNSSDYTPTDGTLLSNIQDDLIVDNDGGLFTVERTQLIDGSDETDYLTVEDGTQVVIKHQVPPMVEDHRKVLEPGNTLLEYKIEIKKTNVYTPKLRMESFKGYVQVNFDFYRKGSIEPFESVEKWDDNSTLRSKLISSSKEVSLDEGDYIIVKAIGDWEDEDQMNVLCNFQIINPSIEVVRRGMKVKLVILPGTITNISQYAFYKATNLTDVLFSSPPNTASFNIYRRAFYGCTKLRYIDVLSQNYSAGLYLHAESLSETGLRTFVNKGPGVVMSSSSVLYSCKDLTDVDISLYVSTNSNVTIGASNFRSCTSLASCSFNLALQSSDTSNIKHITINGATFRGCSKLAHVTVQCAKPYTVAFGYDNNYGGVFQGCTSLETDDLEILLRNASSITNSLCRGCTKLKRVTLSENVATIGGYAFWGCTSLEEVDLSACTSMSTIYAQAFYGCESIKSLKLPLYDESKGVTLKIMDNAFYDAFDLEESKELTLPIHVSHLGTNAFGSDNAFASDCDITIYLDGWYRTLWKANGDPQRTLPSGTKRPFMFNNMRYGVLHGAPDIDIADVGTHYPYSTYDYSWGTRTTHYVDSSGNYTRPKEL